MADLPVPPRRFTCHRLHQMLVIAVRGRLTVEGGAELREWLATAPRPTPPHVVVNLAEVTDLDPSGAEALLDAYVATTLRGGAFVIANATQRLRRSLHRTGVLPLIEVFADDAMAVATLRSRARIEGRIPLSSLADVLMSARPADLNSFEFIRIAALRTAQLVRGCAPLVSKGLKPATTAMREVAAGKVRAIPRTRDPSFRHLSTTGTS